MGGTAPNLTPRNTGAGYKVIAVPALQFHGVTSGGETLKLLLNSEVWVHQ